MRRFLGSIPAALWALGTVMVLAAQLHVSPAKAVAFGEDDRRAVARTPGTEGAAIGLVFYQNGEGQFAAGTGFLVSPCHVLTAYHVAAGGDQVDETKVSTFYVGDGTAGPDFPDLDRFADSTTARPVVWGRYVNAEGSRNLLVRAEAMKRNGWEDWALLKLDTCLGAAPYAYGHLKLAPITTRELMRGGASLAARSIGLPGDKTAASLWEDPTCRLIGQLYLSGWQHDCMTIPGNSGGPILAKDPATGEQRVAAITVSHISVEGLAIDASDALVLAKDDPNYYDYLAIAVPVSAFVDRIAPYLATDTRVAQFVARTRHDVPYSENDSAAAIGDLGIAIKAHPKAAELYVLRAIWNRHAEHADAVRKDLEAALALNDALSPARYLRGRLALELGDAPNLRRARDDFAKLAERHSGSPDLLLYRGMAESRLAAFDLAIADFDTVLKRQPKSAVATNERGDAWRGLRDFEKALADYNLAIEFASTWPEAYRDRGYLFHVLAKHDQARGDFDRAIRLNNRDAEAWNGRALVSLAEGRISDAIKDFNQAIKLVPESGSYFANRATARLIDGDEKRAIEDFKLAVKRDPDEPFVRLLLFIAQSRAGQGEEARGMLTAYAGAHKDPAWPRPIIDLFLGKGTPAQVEKAATVAAAKKDAAGQGFDANFYIGQWALLSGDEEDAVRRLKSVYDTSMREYLEFDIARADLDDLGGLGTRIASDHPAIPTGNTR
jgi:tetratricopeptide (TPR) repeat protein/V8-like Glu-specific endopeptidase